MSLPLEQQPQSPAAPGFRPASGTWYRRGGRIVVDLGETSEKWELAEEMGRITSRRVRRPDIHVDAQRSLLRIARTPEGNQEVLDILKWMELGLLGGIHHQNQPVASRLARSLGPEPWSSLRAGEDAVFLFPRRGKAILVFRASIRNQPQRLDRALRRAWRTFHSRFASRQPAPAAAARRVCS